MYVDVLQNHVKGIEEVLERIEILWSGEEEAWGTLWFSTIM